MEMLKKWNGTFRVRNSARQKLGWSANAGREEFEKWIRDPEYDCCRSWG